MGPPAAVIPALPRPPPALKECPSGPGAQEGPPERAPFLVPKHQRRRQNDPRRDTTLDATPAPFRCMETGHATM